jgi:hypothetical protein
MDLFNNLITVRYKDDELLSELKMFKLNNEDIYSKLNKRLDNIQYVQNSILFILISIIANRLFNSLIN